MATCMDWRKGGYATLTELMKKQESPYKFNGLLLTLTQAKTIMVMSY